MFWFSLVFPLHAMDRRPVDAASRPRQLEMDTSAPCDAVWEKCDGEWMDGWLSQSDQSADPLPVDQTESFKATV